MSKSLLAQGEFVEQKVELISTKSLQLLSNNHEFAPVLVKFERDIPFLNIVVKIKEKQDLDVLNNCWIRFSEDGLSWSEYQRVLKDSHESSYTVNTISDLIYADASTKYVQLKVNNILGHKIDFSSLQLSLSAPSTNDRIFSSIDANSYRAGCELPPMQARGEWCSLAECPVISGGTWTDVSHLIVHHSAGSSTNSNWPAVVRSIWHYHVDERGWDDVGYNWLIDANGILYEGRPDNIRGAHMCGHNSNTMGVCVLGNFETHNITDEAMGTLQALLAWKSEQKDLDPLATVFHSSADKNLKTIAGHKDGCNPGYTLCPGTNFYPLFPDMRAEVNNILAPCISGIDENETVDFIRLKSNMVSSQLEIENHKIPYSFTIFDLNGTKISSGIENNSNIIDVENCLSGSYFIRFNLENRFVTRRFVKL